METILLNDLFVMRAIDGNLALTRCRGVFRVVESKKVLDLLNIQASYLDFSQFMVVMKTTTPIPGLLLVGMKEDESFVLRFSNRESFSVCEQPLISSRLARRLKVEEDDVFYFPEIKLGQQEHHEELKLTITYKGKEFIDIFD